MAITLRQVAKEANVSTATVSRILSGHKAEVFPEETQRRIRDVAHKLGYKPNLTARSLQMKRSFLIGILMNAANSILLVDFLRGVQSLLNQGDYSPVVFSHADCDEQADCLRRSIDRRVDGLIVNASHDAAGVFDEARFGAIVERGLPVVEVFGRALPGVPQVNVDNRAAGRKSVLHLIQLGHRRIAMLTHERYQVSRNTHTNVSFDAWERFQGYEAAMCAAGLPPLVFTHPIAGEVGVEEQFVSGGCEAFDAIMAHPAQPTAVVCYNDLEAYGLIRAARLRGVAVPERLSIVGYADMDLSRVIAPALTTMVVPAFEVGRQATQAILERIEERPVESDLIESELVVRESTMAARD